METSDTDQSKPNLGLKVVREWIVVVGVALVIALVVRTFLLQQFYISGPSMESTMFQDNRVLVNKMSYKIHDIYRGDVVVFDRITTDGEVIQHDDLIKRVIAIAGDVIEIKDCVVYIDGQQLSEPYLNDFDLAQENLEDRCRVPQFEPTTVSANHVFVLGDNRPQSFDSRMFGEIEEQLVVGRAFSLIWPLRDARWL